MFRQIMNDIYKEILEVCKAMLCAKPCPPTLHLKNKQTSIFSSASLDVQELCIVFDFVILFRNNVVIKISEEQLKLGKDPGI